MKQVKQGDLVKVHYTGKLTTGEQFDSSIGREPLQFSVGSGQMIKGFDDALPGMAVGEKKNFIIPAAEAYGERSEENMVRIPKENIPQDMQIEVGMQLMMSNDQGQNFEVTVAELIDDIVVLDANHFLAGKDLVFDIELIEIA
ncbi:MAG: peptidylprolyl isomerase [Ferruginibacter sp.]|nr:peptidylprolyl isomerase [Ferruginibacter sp.]